MADHGPEDCGMCWRGPGSNPACAEHHEQYVARLERLLDHYIDRCGDLSIEVERLSSEIGALSRQ